MTNVGFLVDKFGEPLKTPVMTDEMRRAGAAGFAGVTPNGLVGSDGAPIPGVPTLAQQLRSPIFSFSNTNTPPPMSVGRGTKIVDVSSATTTGAISATVPTSALALSSGGKVIQITGNSANTPSIDLSAFGAGFGGFPLTTSDVGICFEAFKPIAGLPTPITIYLGTNSAFTNGSYCNILIYPGQHLYCLPFPMGTTGNGWGVFGSSIFGQTCAYMRIKQNVYAGGYTFMATGDYVQIGDFFINPTRPRPRIIFDFDGNDPELIYPGTNAATGYDGVSRQHSFCSFLATFGWSPTCGIITGAVGNIANTMTLRDWQQARDRYGAAIISHGHVHAQASDVATATAGGDPLLGPYGFSIVGAVAQTAASSGLQFTPANDLTAIQNDIDLSCTALRKWGFDEGTKHRMLSQGGYDQHTNNAMEGYAFKSIRAAVTNGRFCGNPLTYSTVPLATSGQFNECQSMLTNRQAMLGFDSGAVTAATMQTFIDMIIFRGGIGTVYTHSFGASATTIANYVAFCNLVKAAELNGLLDVVTAYAIGSR